MKTYLTILALFSVAFAIDIDSTFEGSCIKPPSAEVDPKLLMNGETKWYISFGSQYEMIRNVMSILEKSADKLSQKDMEKHNCMYFTFGQNPGFVSNDFFVNLDLKPKSNGALEWVVTTQKPVYGTSYVTLTDNETFMVMINYWDNQTPAWVALSTSKILDERVKAKVSKHITAFGFDPEKSQELDPNVCFE